MSTPKLGAETTCDPRAPLAATTAASSRFRAIYSIGRELLEQKDPQRVIQTIHHAIVLNLKPDHACVLALAADGSHRPLACHNLDLKGPEDAWALSRSVPVNRNMAGIWTGRHSRIGNAITINFTQSGTTLGGTMTLEPVTGGSGQTLPLTGSISGSSNFVCPCEVNFVATGFSTFPLERGQVDVTVNVLTGPGNVDTGAGILSGVWTLTRR